MSEWSPRELFPPGGNPQWDDKVTQHYSTPWVEAKEFAEWLKSTLGDGTIFDMTSHVGGNAIAFGRVFKKLIVNEIDPKYFEMLKHNLHEYDIDAEMYNCDASEMEIPECDFIFIDPPWFASLAKTLKIGKYDLVDFVKSLDKYVIMKVTPDFVTDRFRYFTQYNVYRGKNKRVGYKYIIV